MCMCLIIKQPPLHLMTAVFVNMFLFVNVFTYKYIIVENNFDTVHLVTKINKE